MSSHWLLLNNDRSQMEKRLQDWGHLVPYIWVFMKSFHSICNHESQFPTHEYDPLTATIMSPASLHHENTAALDVQYPPLPSTISSHPPPSPQRVPVVQEEQEMLTMFPPQLTWCYLMAWVRRASPSDLVSCNCVCSIILFTSTFSILISTCFRITESASPSL